jgi:hypothetical protein
MITIDRSVLEQALDALEQCYDVESYPANGKTIQDDAITALREALAQPASQPTEPAYTEAVSLATALFKKHFAHEEHYASGRIVWGPCDTTAGVISQIDNMVSGLIQPASQQEPAAWWNGEWTTPVIAFSRDTPGIGLKNPNAVPLYTRPAVPLADERERLCAAIDAADYKAREDDYIMDSDDCIKVIRGTWNPPRDKIGGAE